MDVDGFVTLLLKAAGLHEFGGELRYEIEALRQRLNVDARHQLNGHDFVELLHWERREYARVRELRNADAVGTALMASFEYGPLSDLPLFKALVSRVSS